MRKAFVLCIYLIILSYFNNFAQEKPASSPEELAKKLANPVASLISLPFQNNTDYGIGPYNGSRNTLNIQPVIPLSLTSSLNLITRWIFPVIGQRDITDENTKQDGLGDAVISTFVSPKESKLIWGVGPVFLVPIATNDFLGTKKFGIGPTALVLKQAGGWTFGALMNQIWSVAGEENRSNVNQMFLQPFLAHNWKSGAGVGVNAEITQNWEASTTTTFINPTVSGVTKLGTQIISLAVGPRIPVGGPDNGKADFGFRGVLTFVFPK